MFSRTNYMRVINKFLQEYYPDHPSDVVIKNKFYPSGLTEKNVYEHYLQVKDKMLDWIGDRYCAFLLRLDEKTTVMRRNIHGSFIKLNHQNFDDIITGRTNVVYVMHPMHTSYFIIDIDPGPGLGQKESLHAAKLLVNELKPKRHEIILPSVTGAHLIGYLNSMQNLDKLRIHLINTLEKVVNNLNTQSKIQYVLHKKGRKPNTINFDMTSMFENSLHICKYSLTKEFLICNDDKTGLKRVKV
jgi:hypothetical protein